MIYFKKVILNILSHLAHFKSYIWLNLGTKFITNITDVIWTRKQMTNSKTNAFIFWIPFLLPEYGYNYLEILLHMCISDLHKI